MAPAPPRIGIVALFGECNAFRTPIPADAYEWMAYHEGNSLLEAIVDPKAFLLPETRGFFAGMEETGPWVPVPLLYAASASGPALDEVLLERVLGKLDAMLAAAGPLDGIYVSGHGSVVGTRTKDVDALLLGLLRTRLGTTVPIIETLDPHGKITVEMIERADILVSLQTDPHVDNYDRGVEAATHMRRLLKGSRPCVAYVRLPIMIPTVGMVAPTAPFKPSVAIGQSRLTPAIANVSILPSYPWTDTPFAGSHIAVSGWEEEPVRRLALDLAEFIWSHRDGFRVRFASIEELQRRANELDANPHLRSLCFADIADNPGGGAPGNTMHALAALVDCGATGCAVGVIHDPQTAADAHAAGVGAAIDVVFNRGSNDPFSRPYATRARVLALAEGPFVARRGVAKGIRLDQGPTASLAVGGVTVVVGTRLLQVLAAEQFEMVGIRIPALRTLVVKSRGHYQGSLDEFYSRDRMIEVDAPGWMTPHLDRLPYQHIPRPLYPMDPSTEWKPALTHFKPARRVP